MNPEATVVDPTAPLPPPPQPPRSSFSCDRHPDERFSGFCPSCLCERLVTLDKSSSNTPSSSRRPSSASATAAAIRSLFSSSSSSKPVINNSSVLPPAPPKPVRHSFFPELRRTKSFSASKNEASSHFFEPQRKSCDVRLKNSNTLWSLFALDDENETKTTDTKKPSTQNHAHYSLNPVYNDNYTAKTPVFEEAENEDDFKNPENADALEEDGNEITPALDSHLENPRDNSEKVTSNSKTKEYHTTDLGSGEKKTSSGGRFWAVASVFRKKWHNWRRVHKIKNRNNGENIAGLPVEKPTSRQGRETQSEVADYGFGRRSCDTDPRFSLDAGRISFDDPRYSFDEPRASWDGHFIGRSFPRMILPVEESVRNCSNDQIEIVPGGSAQTREYYSDSFSRRRQSLDRSNSSRISETVTGLEKDMIELDPKTLRADFSETFESRKESKKSRSWRIWDFIPRFGNGTTKENEDDDERSYDGIKGVDRSFFESRQMLDRKENRANVFGWKNSNQFGGSLRRTKVEINGHRCKDDALLLEKSRSVRCCPNHVGNESNKFYVKSMRSGGRGMMKPNIPSQSMITSSFLSIY